MNITASAFYGDGSNLTGITASAVQVADGPEYSIQFRRDAPVTGEISGSINLRTNAARDAMFLTGGLYVLGNATIGNGSGGGHIIVNGDPDTKISFGPTAAGDSMDFIVGNHRLIRLDENGTDQVILGSTLSDITYVSGNLTVCEGTASILHLSGCSPITVHAPMSSSYNISASAFYGNGAGITGISLINLDAAGSDTNIQFNQNGEFAANAGLAYDGTGSITVSGNLGALEYLKDWGEGLTATTESLGGKVTLGGYGNPYLQTRNITLQGMGSIYNNFDIGHSGQIQLSSSMADGDSDLEGIKFTNNPGQGLVGFNVNRVAFWHNTASINTDPDVGALEYVWSINSDHTAGDEESAWVKLDLSSSTKNFQVGGRDNIQLQAASGLLVDGLGQFNNGVTVGGATSNFNATVNVNNTSSFGGPATFNNHAITASRGARINGLAASNLTVNVTGNFNNRANFNSNLNANSNVTLGAADGSTSITINASNIDMSTNNSVITLRDGQNGLH